ncbi:unnamed protein product [Onchocerca flexuosa]|uniref:PID domain-containing protein n=1 Tax=Onchocerca flexuosa TaxID=387005 RepID=A0A183HAJ5_9BILA|nr:unnamed protein product [Onchocerca flexuosa]
MVVMNRPVLAVDIGDNSSFTGYHSLDCHQNSKLMTDCCYEFSENINYELEVCVSDIFISFIHCRIKNDEMPARRYDILSAKQLMPDNTGSEDSDDELFAPVRRDDSIRHLIPENIPQ